MGWRLLVLEVFGTRQRLKAFLDQAREQRLEIYVEMLDQPLAEHAQLDDGVAYVPIAR